MPQKITSRKKSRFGKLQRILGPGLITGAADDDPSGIATYSQTGAQFGYSQLWISAYALPLMIAVQEACARIGKVTGKGIAAIVKEHYGRNLAITVTGLVLIANTINIGADIGAMAEAVRLIMPINFVIATLSFTVIVLLLQIFISYKTYARILKWLALSMLTYVATVFIINEPWGTLLKATFIPHVELTFPFLFIIVGVIGTTITPYMFFWEANEEVEEEKQKHIGKDLEGRPLVTKNEIRRMRWDNFLGMSLSNMVTWCIIVTSATVLFTNGVTNIATASDAAQALEPLVQTFPNAGFIAKALFAIGIIGLGLLAVPVLSSSASYAVAETFSWKAGLNYKLKKAHGFYGVITIATLIGLTINFIGLDPIKALIVAAVINGVVAIPLIFLIIKIANNQNIMGQWKSGLMSNIFVWITFFVMLVAAVAMMVSYI
jgi:NRAMP (natural resistance-associated macrophage protein)-like metal ion transporter